MRKIIISAGILIGWNLMAQSNDSGKNIPAIFPPTPESFKFATFGNVPVGLFTGSPNIDIPITVFSFEGIKLPISLNYSCNGIKVDDTNGSVGLGWKFINAGVITRIIRDMPDELNTQGNIETPDIATLGLNDPTVINYLTLCQNDDFDSESDLYMANFAGKNLKFIIKKSGDIVQLEKSGSVIAKVNGGFVIKTEDGIEYTFNDKENVRNFMTNTGQHHGEALVNTSAWYLSKIRNQANQEINIQYNDVNFTTTIGQSQSIVFTKANQLKYSSPTNSPDGNPACPTYCSLLSYSQPPSLGLISDSQQSVFGKQIKKIYDGNGNYVLFEYQSRNDDYYLLKTIKNYSSAQLLESFDLDYDITANERVFLKYINEIRSGRKYSFEYNFIDMLPNRLSLSKDMWGYYNGAINSSLIPQIYEDNDPNVITYTGANQKAHETLGQAGLLKKITYPTGGSTSIIYESHKSQKVVTIPAQQTSTGAETFNDRYTYVSSSQITFTPPLDGPIQIGGGNAIYGEGNCANSPLLETQKQAAEIDVYDFNGTLIGSKTYLTDSGGVFTITGQKNKPITIKATARFACSFASVHATYYISEPTQGFADKLYGGYRVASTKDETIESVPITKSYEYVKSDGTYSMIEAYTPYFLANRSTVSTCQSISNFCQPPIQYFDSILTSSNLNQYNSLNPNIFYSRVVENLGNRGKIIHEFDTGIDEFGSVGGDGVAGAQSSNTAWKSGKELFITYLDGNDSIIKKEENIYTESVPDINISFSLATNKKYESGGNSGGLGQFDNLDYVLYKNISRFTYLSKQKTTDYLDGNPVLTQTEYFYENPSHFQISKEKVTLPEGIVNETNYQYAHEKGNQLMIDKNMVGIPLETAKTQTVGGITSILSKTETIYPTSVPTSQTGNLVLPTSILSYSLQNPTTGSTEITYDKYDAKGNLQQYTTKDGISTAIIWGYNSTQPIAKIEGAKLLDINPTLISAIVSASDTDASSGANNDETTFLSTLNDFRNDPSLSTYQITTFTYDPLIGVRSITPPSGIREVYIYDSANRLKEIREQNQTGKLLKEYQYNYKN